MSVSSAPQPPPGTVTVLGLPWDHSSSFLRGAALGPARIREALRSESSNLAAETGLDLGAEPRWRDLGDVELSGPAAADRERIEGAVAEALEHSARVLSLGGDHAVTYPILRAYGRHYRPLNLLYFDAHPDLYDLLRDNRYSHGCPCARIMEEGLASRLVQVGIRTLNPHQRDQAERFGVEIVAMRDLEPDFAPDLTGPTYVSCDLDVLEPGLAPGVSHHEPGGLTVRELLRILHRLRAPIVGADVVELNPLRDPQGITAMVAAKLVKELAAAMLQGEKEF